MRNRRLAALAGAVVLAAWGAAVAPNAFLGLYAPGIAVLGYRAAASYLKSS